MDANDRKYEEDQKELKLILDWDYKFKQAMVHKAPLTKEWHDYWEAYLGDFYKSKGKPEYKSDQVSNFIFSTVETIRPVMVDGDPGFIVKAKNEEGQMVQEKVQNALDHEFQRERMSIKIPRQTMTSLVLGTAVWYLPWDGDADSDYDGEIKATEVNPFNLYPDPMATSIKDAEYLIYATYKHVNKLKNAFPDKANLLEGSGIKYEELVASQGIPSKVNNQVLVLEIYCRDYTTIESEEEIDGKKYKVKNQKYKNGRVLTIAPELELLLEDKANPYQDGQFPFVLMKDYDIPYKFWGEGEIKQLLSPQQYVNDLSNQVIDNAKLTANMPWIIDKNSGIGMGSLTNRPGLVIRKNPGTEVRRESPPSMPNYVNEKIETLKADMESISGVHDVTQGRRPTGIQAGNAIMALQEAGQARIRIKVKLMEESLGNLATMWYSRMQQFWKLDRWIRVDEEMGQGIFEVISSDDLQHSFDVDIVSGSTMQKNRAGMLDLLIRLAQTTAQDGLPMIDREALLEYTDIKDKDRIARVMAEMAEQQNINDEVMNEVSMMGEETNATADEVISIVEEMAGAIEQITQEVMKLKEKDGEEEMMETQDTMSPDEIPGQQVMPGVEEEEMGISEEEQEVQYLLELIAQEGWTPDEFAEIAEQQGVDEGLIDEVLTILLGEEMEAEPTEGGMIPDELLQMISELSEEEMMQLAEQRPDLLELIENNLV